MVWAALQSEPITITEAAPEVVRPRHVRELADLVLAVVNGQEPAIPPEYPVRLIADVIASIRAGQVHDRRATAADVVPVGAQTCGDGELRFQLQHFSQWLAYEYLPIGPTTST